MEERGNPADCVAAVKLKPHKQTEKSDNYLLLLFSINCEIERKKNHKMLNRIQFRWKHYMWYVHWPYSAREK